MPGHDLVLNAVPPEQVRAAAGALARAFGVSEASALPMAVGAPLVLLIAETESAAEGVRATLAEALGAAGTLSVLPSDQTLSLPRVAWPRTPRVFGREISAHGEPAVIPIVVPAVAPAVVPAAARGPEFRCPVCGASLVIAAGAAGGAAGGGAGGSAETPRIPRPTAPDPAVPSTFLPVLSPGPLTGPPPEPSRGGRLGPINPAGPAGPVGGAVFGTKAPMPVEAFEAGLGGGVRLLPAPLPSLGGEEAGAKGFSRPSAPSWLRRASLGKARAPAAPSPTPASGSSHASGGALGGPPRGPRVIPSSGVLRAASGASPGAPAGGSLGASPAPPPASPPGGPPGPRYAVTTGRTDSPRLRQLLAEVRGITLAEARRLCRRPVIDVAEGLSLAEAEALREKFSAAGIAVNVEVRT